MSYILSYNKLGDFLKRLRGYGEVLIPFEKKYIQWNNKIENKAIIYYLEHERPMTTLKDIILPPIHSSSYTLPQLVIFGAPICDVVAVKNLLKHYKKTPQDPFLKLKTPIIFERKCNYPTSSCFCMHNFSEEISDFHMNLKKNGIELFPKTARARELVGIFSELFLKDSKELNIKKRHYTLTVNKKNLLKNAQKCIRCLACERACPTCFCYKLIPYDNKIFIKQDFCYDRKEKNQKHLFSIRFSCKILFFKDIYGTYGCVGCGRCIEVCPSKIDIREIIDVK